MDIKFCGYAKFTYNQIFEIGNMYLVDYYNLCFTFTKEKYEIGIPRVIMN